MAGRRPTAQAQEDPTQDLVTGKHALHFARCGACKQLVLRDVHGANFTPALGLPHRCGQDVVERVSSR